MAESAAIELSHAYKRIIGQLNEAKGPDSKLDQEIAQLCKIEWSADEDGSFGGYGIVPRRISFTSSLDAAMTLVPDGWALGISTLAERPMVEIFERVNDRSFSLRADTLPLALCIAALKAKQHSHTDPT